MIHHTKSPHQEKVGFFFMLVLFCPEGGNILDLASILASFSPEEQMPSCQCVCTAHLGSLLPFYLQVQEWDLVEQCHLEFSEIPRLFWDCQHQLIEGKGEGEGLNIARKERKIKGRDKAHSFCKTLSESSALNIMFQQHGLSCSHEGDRAQDTSSRVTS